MVADTAFLLGTSLLGNLFIDRNFSLLDHCIWNAGGYQSRARLGGMMGMLLFIETFHPGVLNRRIPGKLNNPGD